ncbi:MAG: hypothetical protein KKA42_05795 [candidate division Zixibacteria bacterium]|nr:hypothetical protein [candidate division Zixibacteria bacterium]
MQKHEFVFDGEIIDTSAEKVGEAYRVQVGDKSFDIRPVAPGLFATFVDGRKVIVASARDHDTTYVGIEAAVLELSDPSSDGFGGGAGDQAGEKDKIYAPMPGKIVKLMVAVGDTVAEKQHVVIVEAMKMENPVLAKANGTVKAINFAEGDQVDTDHPIVELELDE